MVVHWISFKEPVRAYALNTVLTQSNERCYRLCLSVSAWSTWDEMPCRFKFACVGIASMVIFAGVMMSMELLHEVADGSASLSRAGVRFNRRTEGYAACGGCTSHHSSSVSYRGRKLLSRKWGHMAPPTSLLTDVESKVRMTPEAKQWKPFLRRTKGFLIDYSKESNSTQYTYLDPDPVAIPSSAPPTALPPDNFDHIIQWMAPNYTFFPPITNWTEPPIA